MSRISLIKQARALKSYFPDSKIFRKGEDEIAWIHRIQPTPMSIHYQVKVHYIKGKGISAYVLSPKPLQLAKGEKYLPHVYSTPKQKLCLFYPKDNEWNNGMYYVKTIIPWISEWLYHYEIWVGIGDWRGGGVNHDTEQKKQDS